MRLNEKHVPLYGNLPPYKIVAQGWVVTQSKIAEG